MRLLSFAVWALVSATAVFWASRLLTQGAPAPAHAVTAGQSLVSASADLSRVLGSTRVDAPVAAVASAEPAVNARFKLVGVVASRGARPDSGLALIAVDGKAPKPIGLGGVVDGSLVLLAVNHRRAELGPSGGQATVTLDLPLAPEPNRAVRSHRGAHADADADADAGARGGADADARAGCCADAGTGGGADHAGSADAGRSDRAAAGAAHARRRAAYQRARDAVAGRQPLSSRASRSRSRLERRTEIGLQRGAADAVRPRRTGVFAFGHFGQQGCGTAHQRPRQCSAGAVGAFHAEPSNAEARNRLSAWSSPRWLWLRQNTQ